MIGDYLGKFLSFDRSYKVHECMRVARFLLSLETRLGFLEEINLEICRSVHTQPLDYQGISFLCIRCHALDHLVDQCPHPLRIKGPYQNS